MIEQTVAKFNQHFVAIIQDLQNVAELIGIVIKGYVKYRKL